MLEVFAPVDGGRNGFAESVDVWKVVAAGIANDMRRLASVLKGSYSIDQILTHGNLSLMPRCSRVRSKIGPIDSVAQASSLRKSSIPV